MIPIDRIFIMDTKHDRVIAGVNMTQLIATRSEYSKLARTTGFKDELPQIPKYNSNLKPKKFRDDHFAGRIKAYKHRLQNWAKKLEQHVRYVTKNEIKEIPELDNLNEITQSL